MAGRDYGSLNIKNYVRFIETSGAGPNYVALTAPSSVTSSYQASLPGTVGISGQFLQTDGVGALTWANVSSSAISHTGLSNINGGTYTDGGHTYLTQSHLGLSHPNVTDDITAYKVNTIWNYSNETYTCVDNTVGAAVWHKLLYAGGTLVAEIGSVTNPSLYFSTNSSSGLYQVGPNDIGLTISGSKVLDINSVGLSIIGKVVNTSGTDYGFVGGDGSLSLPSFRFVNSSNCGLYRIGANNIGFVINGSVLLNMNTVGLGVGQAASTEALEVNGNIKATGIQTSGTRLTPTTIAVLGPTLLNNAHGLILCDCTSTPVSISLPALATYPGIVYHIAKIDSSANTVTITADGSENIDNVTSIITLTSKNMIVLTNCSSFWSS